ncbi:MAG TPA: TetR/AcrR family transcriptional regulator [Thermoanaerobaculia bacterium]|nr:TetR/AcrR family transcriptional regulator [Thermoanaerobaculia bacterium]
MSGKTKEKVVEQFRCESIQDAAMRVIARKGIEETTIQNIADEAGIAKGTVYVYFRDRDELLAKTADRAFEGLVNDLRPQFETSGPFADRLRGLVQRQLRFFDEHRALFRATLALTQRETELRKQGTRCYTEYAAMLAQFLTDASAAGELRSDIDPQELAAVYRDCVRGVIIRRLDQKVQKARKSVEDDAELIVSILLHGIQSGDSQ